MDLLTKIIESKKRRVEAAKDMVPLIELRRSAETVRRARPAKFLRNALSAEGINIIAEFKRRSPSKSDINTKAEPASMARSYESGGAKAISVLTEEDFFAGSLDDLHQVRSASTLPILRKDFVFDDYQVYESAAAGADALLLIVAALDQETLTRLRTLAEDELSMDALVEVHTKEELARAVDAGAKLIGVNNRNLRTFEVSTAVSVELARVAPLEATLVSESGLTPPEIQNLKAAGYSGFLVGEALMRAHDPSTELRRFINDSFSSGEPVLVKICGITTLEDARAAINAGADLLGFNFYRASPRYIAPESARTIIEAMRLETAPGKEIRYVGVFVDPASPEELVRIVERSAIDAVQLHGDESAQFCEAVKRLLPKVKVIKVFRVRNGFDPTNIRDFPADAIMLDSFHPELRGGTGRSFDWAIAKRTGKFTPRLILAGGLTPENVARAIAEVKPYAVDVCSAVETAPGVKDAQRMQTFVRSVRSG